VRWYTRYASGLWGNDWGDHVGLLLELISEGSLGVPKKNSAAKDPMPPRGSKSHREQDNIVRK
jgi:hypothetical protein